MKHRDKISGIGEACNKDCTMVCARIIIFFCLVKLPKGLSSWRGDQEDQR
jgi:hypothetical protein